MGYESRRRKPVITFEVEDGRPEDPGPRAFLLWAWATDENGEWKAYHYHRLLDSVATAAEVVPFFAKQVAERGDRLVPGGLRLLVVRS